MDILLWLLSRSKGRIAILGTVGLGKPKIFTFQPFAEKKMLTSGFNDKYLYYRIE